MSTVSAFLCRSCIFSRTVTQTNYFRTFVLLFAADEPKWHESVLIAKDLCNLIYIN
jgi:hypothetical protein